MVTDVFQYAQTGSRTTADLVSQLKGTPQLTFNQGKLCQL